MRILRIIVLVGLLFSVNEKASATIINVPGNSSTIQGGINSANAGDTVLVADNIYYERIDFLGKPILVSSQILTDSNTAHILNTIIDADTSVIGIADTGSVVSLTSGEDTSSILQGFTIRNGIGTLSGGSDRYGGGIYIASSDANIKHCLISINTADYGGGIGCSSDLYTPTIQISNSIISLNSASSGSGFAGWGNILIDSSRFETGQDFYNLGISSSSPAFSCSTSISRYYNCDFVDGGSSICMLSADNSYFNGGQIGLKFCSLTNDSLANVTLSLRGFWISSITQCDFINSDIYVGLDTHLSIDSTYMEGAINAATSQFGPLTITNSIIIDGGINVNLLGYGTANLNLLSVDLIGKGIDLNDYYSLSVEMERVIIFTDSIPSIICDQSGTVNLTIACSDFDGFYSSWLDCIPDSLDTSYLFFEDPEFCGSANENPFTIADTSICAPANNACGVLIGAFGIGCGVGCDYVTGDVNGSGSYNGLDITYGVNYLKGGSDPMCPFGSCGNPPCDAFFYCGDVNGSCSYNGLDITYGVNYLKGGNALMHCPDCPPAN